ncbi:shikimate dehydrogenase [Thauera linaloolentis]|uniref:Shikimate dehydrogenase (NADP(+)) n=1 Tax=Thauera linaloolentis (strain DSM 12138 / JCM 21573 / CCUG 41526 / CIP 105981 / IAM 15112 / NBRC 102519 / 47Lol) TaxID=1123367 RepID=N6Z4T4_THAL4|nr:shikimate dehydrogenase [Thauera linaloolentis]ENO89418.1 shikimate 5-dehydrogenase [Thauera linaloolentis 47Lol = DSM 12138]MCM8564358.1 shikimate dehydrogenase [Thauera linaloolentis]
MDRYAVIGHPIAHSKSPQIHAAFARQTAQDMCYEAILAPLDGFAAAVRAFRAAGGRGMNVTVPFKLEAFALAERRTPRAQAAGAVNTLAFDAGGLLGDNTDGAGLVRDLTANHGCALRGRRVLLLGAGGAARGALLPLLAEGPAVLTIANRTVAKAESLAATFLPSTAETQLSACGFDGLAGQHFDLVINATAASLADQAPPLPPGLYAEEAFAYDMMYGRGDTPFIAAARADGAARLADGLGMLVEQAAESFALWRGLRPDSTAVLAALRRQLGAG